MDVYCCVATVAFAGTFGTLAECGNRCGPTCHSYGAVGDKCALCSGPIVRAGNASECTNGTYDKLLFAASEPRGCTGRECHVCNTTDLSSLPLSPILYVAPCDVKFGDVGPPAVVKLDLHDVVFAAGVDMRVRGGDTVILHGGGNASVSAHGSFRLTGGGGGGARATVVLQSDVECGVRVSALANKVPVDVVLRNVDVDVAGPECAVCVSDVTLSKGQASEHMGSIVWDASSVTSTTTGGKWYALAVAGVHAAVDLSVNTSVPGASVLTLDTHDQTMTVRSTLPVIDISSLLSVFGTAYEIEYWCHTSDSPKACRSASHKWVAQANGVLLPLALLLACALFSNPSRLFV